MTYEVKIIVEGDGSTDPPEGTHTYDDGEQVTLNAFPDEADTPNYIKERLLRTLPEFYDKHMDDADFIGWFEEVEDEEENGYKWEKISDDEETVITVDENKKIKAEFTFMRSNFNALMESIGREIEELMITFEEVLDAHFVDEAEGVHLDEIGQMWGILRIPDESDESYRERIKAYAPGFGGGGSLDDLTATLRWYAGEDNFYLEEFSEDVEPDNRKDLADAGEEETWDENDIIDFHYKVDNVDEVVNVYDRTEETTYTEDVDYEVDYSDGTIEILQDTSERYLKVEYSLNEIEQHGRFKVYIDPTGDILVDVDRIIYEIDKFKAGGIIVEFGAFDFPEVDETIRMSEDDKIEGHMVGDSEEEIGGTYVNDANVVLESD